MVPHLVTAHAGPLNDIEQRVLEAMPAVERWFRLEWMEHTPPFYCSVDMRNAGFKLAPVNTNLFPSGWNHLSKPMLPLAVQAAMAAIEKICPEARNLLLIPENDLHDSFYLANLAQLVRIFRMAGLRVRVGSISPELKAPVQYTLADGDTLLIEPVCRSERRIGLQHFDPCTILLNNDLRAGVPGILEDLHEQYVLPPLQAGWSVRSKARHFACYDDVSKRFGKLLGIDPWLVNPLWARCGDVDLSSNAGVDALRGTVDALLGRIRRKYKEYGITEKPFVLVKTDNGALGHGIATVRDAADLAHLAGRCRERLAQRPGASRSRALVVQEGVLTCERVHEAVAEPVAYLMDRYVVGGFYRVHADRGEDETLNTPGAQYLPLAFDKSMLLPELGKAPGASAPNRFYLYGVIARLAMLAASYELEATDPLRDTI